MTIVEFLTARLDEAEQYTLAHVYGRVGIPGPVVTQVGDPRILADIAAKRAILALHVPRYGGSYCATCIDPDSGPPGDGEWFPCPTVSHLASVYSDHPDYDPAWSAA